MQSTYLIQTYIEVFNNICLLQLQKSIIDNLIYKLIYLRFKVNRFEF